MDFTVILAQLREQRNTNQQRKEAAQAAMHELRREAGSEAYQAADAELMAAYAEADAIRETWRQVMAAKTAYVFG